MDIIETIMAARSPRKTRTPTLKRSIPKNAREELVRDCYPGGGGIQPREMACYVGRKYVGRRSYNEHGQLVHETPLRNSKPHGFVIWWDDDGSLISAEPYRDGLAHGTTRQYHDGKVIGTYVMKNGVGVDVWRNMREDESWFISELLWIKSRRRLYICWLLNEDEKTVWSERIYGGRGKKYFEIERSWNQTNGTLDRGYPKFTLGNKRVSKAQYLTARKKRRHLPPVRDEDRLPRREFPPVVVRAMKRKPR